MKEDNWIYFKHKTQHNQCEFRSNRKYTTVQYKQHLKSSDGTPDSFVWEGVDADLLSFSEYLKLPFKIALRKHKLELYYEKS